MELIKCLFLSMVIHNFLKKIYISTHFEIVLFCVQVHYGSIVFNQSI